MTHRDIPLAAIAACVTQRTVRPIRLESYGDRECLVAFCELRQDERHFRLDRIIDVQERKEGEQEDSPPFYLDNV